MTSAFTFYFPSILPLRIYSETEKKMINDFILSRTKIQTTQPIENENHQLTDSTQPIENKKTQKNNKDKIYIELKINKYVIGKIIGKQGVIIEEIRKKSNAYIRVMREGYKNTRSIYINGSKNDVIYAKKLINEYLNK